MLPYDLGPGIDAFTTHISDPRDFKVLLPAHQAHSALVECVNDYSDTPTGVDALVTTVPGLRIGVKTADCVPVLLGCASPGIVAAVHSGWKGTVANISACAVESIRNLCPDALGSLRAVIGPCIHQEAFEVGDELYDLFAAEGYAPFCRRMPRFGFDSGVKWHIDLPGIVARQLRQAGVRQVEVRPECTFALHQNFYSARRLGGGFDRQRNLNCIMLLPK